MTFRSFLNFVDAHFTTQIDAWRGRPSAFPFLKKFEGGAHGEGPPLGPLETIYCGHVGRPTMKWRHYLGIYEAEIGRFRGLDVRLLEIGVQRGGSLQVWRKYLGERATIFGVDIDPACKALDTEDLPVRIGSQGDPDFLRRVVAEMGGVDIVIDDGSHVGADQIESFKTLFPLLSVGGVYVIEDVHASYWREYAGGIGRAGTIMSFGKDLIDDLHGWYHRGQPRSLLEARQQVGRIVFYDSVIVIAKAEKAAPEQVFAGRPGS